MFLMMLRCIVGKKTEVIWKCFDQLWGENYQQKCQKLCKFSKKLLWENPYQSKNNSYFQSYMSSKIL